MPDKEPTIVFDPLVKGIYKKKDRSTRRDKKIKRANMAEELTTHPHEGGKVQLFKQPFTKKEYSDKNIDNGPIVIQGSSSSVVMSLNTTLPVTRDCFENLLPNTGHWQQQWEDSNSTNKNIDDDFSFFKPMFKDFSFGRLMKGWIQGWRGYGPAISMEFSCDEKSKLYETINDELLAKLLVEGGQSHQFRLQRGGMYYGPKGAEKTEQRQQPGSIPLSNPLQPSNRDTYDPVLNIEIKFTPFDAKPEQFHHGIYPNATAILNVHVVASDNGISRVDEFEQALIDTLKNKFVPFLKEHEDQILGKKKFQNSSNWGPDKIKSHQTFQPSQSKRTQRLSTIYSKQDTFTGNSDPKQLQQNNSSAAESEHLTNEPDSRCSNTVARKQGMFAALMSDSDSESDNESNDSIASLSS